MSRCYCWVQPVIQSSIIQSPIAQSYIIQSFRRRRGRAAAAQAGYRRQLSMAAHAAAHAANAAQFLEEYGLAIPRRGLPPAASVVPFNIRVSTQVDVVRSPGNYAAYTEWVVLESSTNPGHALAVWNALPLTVHAGGDGREGSPEGARPRGFPPRPRRQCHDSACDRCRRLVGGYRFQHVGPWSAERISAGALQAGSSLA